MSATAAAVAVEVGTTGHIGHPHHPPPSRNRPAYRTPLDRQRASATWKVPLHLPPDLADNRHVADGDNWNFDENWARQSPLREPSAAEREAAARRRRWAAQDAADHQAAARRRKQAVRVSRKARRKKVYPWLIFALIAALLIVASRATGWNTPRSVFADGTAPPPGQGEQDSRILPPVTPTKTSNAYTIGERNPDGTPVTFSPCRTWPIAVNTLNAPKHAYKRVLNAVAELSAATGLAFTVEGTTTETANPDRRAYQPDRYGNRWAPILITWTTGNAEHGFAGHGGPVTITLPDGTNHYITGQITIDADGQFNQDPSNLEAILLHELGHVAGLNHSPDPTELMAPENVGQTGYGTGDLTGLAQLGNGPCDRTV